MTSILRWGLVVYYLATGVVLMVAPLMFYENAPGVSDTGPYNMHFIRDVGFAFTLSAIGVAYGIVKQLKPLMVFGASWIAAHGLFHLVLWILRPDKTSALALIDIALVVLPAAVFAVLCVTYRPPLNEDAAGLAS